MGDEDTDFSLFVTPHDFSPYSTTWIFDSGCACHVCPKWKWFFSYTSLSFNEVLMGNGVSCHVKGIGTIRFKMFDGRVRVIKNVRYILDSKNNLMFLGVLETKGYMVIMENGSLKIFGSDQVT